MVHRLARNSVGALVLSASLSSIVWMGSLTAGPSATEAAKPQPASDNSPALCGSLDTPETGIQGDVSLADQQSGRAEQGYNCGLAVIGYNDLGGAGAGDLTWAGDCAYVKSAGGIKVIDVSDPTAPTVVQTLPITVSSENIHSVTTRKRSLLVAAAVGPNGNGRAPVPVYVWDVRDCTHPSLIGTITFPGAQVHNIELTPDATKIYGSLPLQVADIGNLADPTQWTVVDFQCELAAQAKPGFTGFLLVPFAVDRPQCANQLAHEFEFNKRGTRMYIGGQIDDALGESRDPLHRDWDTEHEFRVVDLTVWPPQIISSIPSRAGGHAIRRAKIKGRNFVLHSNENVNPDVTTANGCTSTELLPTGGVAQAFLTDVSDDWAPRTVSELKLAINDQKNCAAQLSSRVKSTIHYNTVDDPDDTTFAMLPMGNGGLRVFDIRNPEAPVEVAYFNPGQFRLPNGSAALDRTSWHPHYVVGSPCEEDDQHGDRCKKEQRACKIGRDCSTGHIWLTSSVGGFWVLEIEPQVRKALGLPHHFKSAEYPHGRPARAIAISTSNNTTAWEATRKLAETDESNHHH